MKHLFNRIFLVWLAVGMLALTGCASKLNSYVVLLENPTGGTGKVIVEGAEGQQVISNANDAVGLKGSRKAAPVDPAQFRKDFSGVMAARPRLPVQYFLYFESGGTSLTAESLTLLPKIITEVVGRPASDVSIIGHSDTVGKAESNEVLALKRAQSIAELLQEKGMKPFAMVVESHGERNLLVPTPDETPEPRNRRVEVSVR
jgi:outer membrane protein OmpA-like peptidoglycan-associated protein